MAEQVAAGTVRARMNYTALQLVPSLCIVFFTSVVKLDHRIGGSGDEKQHNQAVGAQIGGGLR